jgi:hypothetical protein
VVYQEGLYFIELVIIIEYEHLFTNEVQTLKCTCELCCEVCAQFSERKLATKLGTRVLKSDLKSTITPMSEQLTGFRDCLD